MKISPLKLCASVLLFSQSLNAADYFVSPAGKDANPGTKRETAFQTIQKGVDTLQPGDTLTIAPGDYFESVRRNGIGNEEAETTIRAEIPGSVLLRGDVPVGNLKKFKGVISVTDFDPKKEIQAINELDTLTILERKPSVAELEYFPGFYQDKETGKLYISTSDRTAAANHRYTAAITPSHGIYLVQPKRVILDGLSVTGFNTAKPAPKQEFTFEAVWGIFLLKGKGSTIRNCRTYLNGEGIGIHSMADREEATGDNVVEQCASWANASQVGTGDMGGISLYSPRRDTVRNSTAFLNKEYGIHIYHGWKTGADEKNKSVLHDNLAWGNACDFKIKTGEEYLHAMERSAGPGLWSVKNTSFCLLGSGAKGHEVDNLYFKEATDPDAEFADPANHDYRLQATSRFRKAGADGRDLGPFQYEKNLFFVSNDGNDTADGLSVKNAWKTISHAASTLKPGDTLYLLPGTYEGGELTLKGVTVKGRGLSPAVIKGKTTLRNCTETNFERITFEGDVALQQGEDLRFHNCRFASLAASKGNDLTITHSTFGAGGLDLTECAKMEISGNRFENKGPAIRVDRADSLRYYADNAFANAAEALSVNGKVEATTPPAVALSRAGYPFGAYATPTKSQTLKILTTPVVHSVSATTANIEWTTAFPALCEIAWGTTPECKNRETFVINGFGSYSLTDLQPEATYYFRILSLREPGTARDELLGIPPQGEAVAVTGEPLAFTTAKSDRPPVTYYVAPEGDNGNAGTTREKPLRTIQEAADRVNVGDTVLIAAGRYPETVRLRATGSKAAPIRFRALPGEKVLMDGAGEALSQGFVSGGKSHLRFDAFYFKNYNITPVLGLVPLVAGEFCLYDGKDIQITRCFSDGTGGVNGPRLISAWKVEGLRVQNCVLLGKMSSAITLMRCPDAVLENNVSYRSSISAIVIDNRAGEKATLRNNFFTDMLKKKADLNISLLLVEEGAAPVLDNNGFQLRSFSPDERKIISTTDHAAGKGNSMTLAAYEANAGPTRTLFADPGFAGVKAAAPLMEKSKASPIDILTQPTQTAPDFDAFFATDPETVQRGIGLQPDAFQDFAFSRTP